MVEDGRPDDVDWVAVARTQLYRRKRSANLGDTLRAIAVFDEAASRTTRSDCENCSGPRTVGEQ